jgi:hypothetical protein
MILKMTKLHLISIEVTDEQNVTQCYWHLHLVSSGLKFIAFPNVSLSF